MNRLNVYQSFFNNFKNFKLSKKMVRTAGAIALVVTIASTTVGCSSIKEYNNFKENFYSDNYTVANENNNQNITPSTSLSSNNNYQDSFYNPSYGETDNDLSTVTIKLDNLYYNDFMNYIDNIKVSYPDEELYGIDAALYKYNNLNFSIEDHTGNILKDSKLNAEDLMNTVLKNNQAYMNTEKQKIGGAPLYKELKQKELLEICQIIADTVNYHIEKGLIDIDKVSCNLALLKVFKDAAPDMAYVTKDNCFIINPDMIDVLQIMNPRIDAYRNTIVHEVMHIFQDACIDVQNINDFEMNYGPSYSWPSLKMNPLMFDWFVEAAAEKNGNNYTGQEPSTYQQMIGYLESMSLVTILNDNVEVNQTERITFQNKLEPLFEQFNATTEEQKKELLKMMFAIDILQTDTEDFVSAYETKYNIKLNEESLNTYKHTIKGSICTTLTKQFYANLAKQLTNKEISMQDVFFLITIYENDLYSHLKYTNEDRFGYSEEFLKLYIEIQNQFFNMISKNNNYNNSDLVDNYNNYGMTLVIDDIKYPNYNLSWLSKDKKDYILSREEYLHSISSGNIRSSLPIMLANEYSQPKVK